MWIEEKMLTAQDISYDEARNLHSKWLKHQAFMAELASNQGWLEKLDEVCCFYSPRFAWSFFILPRLNIFVAPHVCRIFEIGLEITILFVY